LRSRDVALVAVLSALGVSFRVVKNLVTQLQFVNFPLLSAFVGSHVGGPLTGFLVAALTYLISDFVILPGVWTLTNALLGGFTAAAFGPLSRRLSSTEYRFAAAFLLCFLFDVASSAVLYVAFGLPLAVALATGIVGLFLPVMGGFMLGVGPLTEFTTALLSTLVIEKVSRVVKY